MSARVLDGNRNTNAGERSRRSNVKSAKRKTRERRTANPAGAPVPPSYTLRHAAQVFVPMSEHPNSWRRPAEVPIRGLPAGMPSEAGSMPAHLSLEQTSQQEVVPYAVDLNVATCPIAGNALFPPRNQVIPETGVPNPSRNLPKLSIEVCNECSMPKQVNLFNMIFVI